MEFNIVSNNKYYTRKSHKQNELTTRQKEQQLQPIYVISLMYLFYIVNFVCLNDKQKYVRRILDDDVLNNLFKINIDLQ